MTKRVFVFLSTRLAYLMRFPASMVNPARDRSAAKEIVGESGSLMILKVKGDFSTILS